MSKKQANSRDRVSRLFLWLDEKLEFLERRHLQTDEPLTSAEHEKDARTMISLIRVYEKLVEMTERLDQKTQGESQDVKGYDSVETEQMRLEIAQRIERLQRQTRREMRNFWKICEMINWSIWLLTGSFGREKINCRLTVTGIPGWYLAAGALVKRAPGLNGCAAWRLDCRGFLTSRLSASLLVGETLEDVRQVMIEGESGLLAIHPKRGAPAF